MVSKDEDIEKAPTKTAKISDSSSSLGKVVTHIESTDGSSITITADDILVPDCYYLAGAERSILEILQDRLRNGSVRPLEPTTHV